MTAHKAGFVNIIGRPNVGKSTLINALMGGKLSIVTPKAQTTRHRILGLINEDDYQIILSDTPGIIRDPGYKLHEAMMSAVHEAVEDADILFLLVEPKDKPEHWSDFLQRLNRHSAEKYLVINKIDTSDQTNIVELMQLWQPLFGDDRIIPASALHGLNVEKIKQIILDHLPEHPAYYPKESYTNRSERFLTEELIREKILIHYKQEVPYSVEVVVTEYKDEPDRLFIRAEIIVNRRSQKPIIIGKGGSALRRIGTEARKELEKQHDKSVFLDLFVKIREGWRDKADALRSFGYTD